MKFQHLSSKGKGTFTKIFLLIQKISNFVTELGCEWNMYLYMILRHKKTVVTSLSGDNILCKIAVFNTRSYCACGKFWRECGHCVCSHIVALKALAAEANNTTNTYKPYWKHGAQQNVCNPRTLQHSYTHVVA